MPWKIHPERLVCVEHEDGPHKTEHEALASLVESLHAQRDHHRSRGRDVHLTQWEQRAARHRVIQLEVPIVRARRRQQALGIKAPIAWDEEKK